MTTVVELLVEHARSVLSDHRVPGWPRATAVLLRQALEAAIDEVWRATAPAMVDTSWRSKLVALVGYIPEDLALETNSLWSTLSGACHVHEYDLAPTTAELQGLLETTRQITTQLAADPP